MTWLLPSALAIAAVTCIALIAAHFIARDRPVAEPLPTARFVPDRRIHARTTSIALSDLLLLALRIAAVAAIGLGIAGPIVAGARGRIARIVLVDRSRSVLSLADARDILRAAGAADVVIAFDSAARTLDAGARAIDSLDKTGATGSLSAALAAASAAATSLASGADSIELALVSPVSTEELDAATPAIRAAWPGRIRLMRLRPKTASVVSPSALELPREPNDPVVAGLSLLPRELGASVRVVRGRLTAADSVWGREAGHVLVHWPAADSATDWPARPNLDAIGGVTSATGAIVARLPRLWSVSGRAIARWADGEPAAVERTLGAGCIRDVAVVVDPASDVTLRAPFRGFSRALLAPCGGARAFAPADSATLRALAGVGPLAAARNFRGAADQTSRFTPWLLALGAALLLVELALRRSSRTLG